ncbi:MAG TPA: pyridoxamine 5'-phosphate oxidase [Luteolibacter sp.]|nr:pyridoxamine 5'-phosphate oxidase [Luteolibacter sp.]
MDLSDFRKEYTMHGLRRADLHADPVEQFSIWFSQAVSFGVHEPNAMTVATVSPDGMPSQRTLLLKQFDASGFVFFTNYRSRKAGQLAENPRASLLFPWITIERQVIVQGIVEKSTAAESDEYFQSRPRDSRIGAWVSDQSAVISNRDFLVARLAEIERQYPGEIPRPPHWGGYRLIPETIEFWQGGAARLHDRFIYRRENSGWQIDRLSP